jgi:hypothetical protein
MSVLELTKDEAFAMTLYDIAQGESLENMRMVLTDYEEREEFEICAGIHLAIEVSSFLKLTAVVNEHLENNIQLTFDEL